MKNIIIFCFCLFTLESIGQEVVLGFYVCKIDSIYFDSKTSLDLDKKDSTSKADQGISSIRMKNPYIADLTLIKAFDKTFSKENFQLRIWSHLNPSEELANDGKYLFITNTLDSNIIKNAIDYYEVFQTKNKHWAEPNNIRRIKLSKSKKAKQNHNVLSKRETDYFRLINEIINCCEADLIKYYYKN